MRVWTVEGPYDCAEAHHRWQEWLVVDEDGEEVKSFLSREDAAEWLERQQAATEAAQEEGR
jgi:hypothetical protein